MVGRETPGFTVLSFGWPSPMPNVTGSRELFSSSHWIASLVPLSRDGQWRAHHTVWSRTGDVNPFKKSPVARLRFLFGLIPLGKVWTLLSGCLVGWGCRIFQLLLCRRVRPPPNERPVYDAKQSNDEVPLMLGLWRIRRTPSLPLHPGPL